MTFEIDRPIHFLSQANYMKEGFGYPTAMTLDQPHQHSPVYSPAYSMSNATQDQGVNKSGMGTEGAYNNLASSYHQDQISSSSSSPSTNLVPVSTSLATTPIYPLGSPYSDMNAANSSPQPSKKTNDIHHQRDLLSPLPTNASLLTPPPLDMVQLQPNSGTVAWKQDMYSSPLEQTNAPWIQQQHDENLFYSASTTPRSLSNSPPPLQPTQLHPLNLPPCNCISIMPQYNTHFNGIPSPLDLAPSPGNSKMAHSSSSQHIKRSRYHRSPYQRPTEHHHQPSYDPPALPSSSSSTSSSSISSSSEDHQQQQHQPSNQPPRNRHASSSSSSSSTENTPRRYKCTVCVKRFTRPSSLATHMHSHTGEVRSHKMDAILY